MKKTILFILFASMSGPLMFAHDGDGDRDGDRDNKQQFGVAPFATLPELSSAGVALGHPEGLCADGRGNIYADSFELPTANGFLQNYIYVFGRDGKLKTATPTPSMVVPLGCIVSGNKFYMNDVIGGNELEYTLPLTDTSFPDRTFKICSGFIQDNPNFCTLNSNYVGPDGRIYMTDNGDARDVSPAQTEGRIFVLDPNSGAVSIFLDSRPELTVAPGPYVPNGKVLPFSVNGIAFSRDGKALYLDNMSTGRIYKLTVHHCRAITGCEAGDFSLFSDDARLQGPDNMDFDEDGNLWVASGQNNHVIALNPHGKVIGEFGKFLGFDKEGAPRGLLQPSGIIFSKGNIYIGNESNAALVPAGAFDVTKLKLFTLAVLDTDVLKRGW